MLLTRRCITLCCWSIFYKEEPSALLFFVFGGRKNKCKKIRKNNLTLKKFGILIMCKENKCAGGAKEKEKK